MNDSLGDRMKAYEAAWSRQLPPRLPIILRVDGRAFHTVTAKAQKPFDASVSAAMLTTTKTLVAEVAGCQFGYQQSDEISLLVHPYKKFATQAWFGGDVDKMVSVAASLASVTFSRVFGRDVEFDARVFVLPEADVNNYFLWRQRDAIRNSVSSLARSHFGPAKLKGVNGTTMREMCREAGRPWEALEAPDRLGTVVAREPMGNHPTVTYPDFLVWPGFVDHYLAVEEQ